MEISEPNGFVIWRETWKTYRAQQWFRVEEKDDNGIRRFRLQSESRISGNLYKMAQFEFLIWDCTKSLGILQKFA